MHAVSQHVDGCKQSVTVYQSVTGHVTTSLPRHHPMPPMGSNHSQSAQRKAKAQAKKQKSLAKKPKPLAKNLSDKETAGHRKWVPTRKARELDIAELASEEEGSDDANFVPSAIPLPDSDDGSSGTE